MLDQKVFLTQKCLENKQLLQYISSHSIPNLFVINDKSVLMKPFLVKKLLQNKITSYKIINCNKWFVYFTIPERISKELLYLKLTKNQDKIIIVCSENEEITPLDIWNELIINGITQEVMDIKVCFSRNFQNVIEVE